MRRRVPPTCSDMSSVFCLLNILLLAVGLDEVSCASYTADDKCLKQQEKCQNCSAEYFTTKIMLSASRKVRDEVTNAQNVIMRAGGEEVVKLFSQYSLATSVNYFCCLSDEEKTTVAERLQRSPEVLPNMLHYQGVRCMKSSDGIIIMFVLDKNSEAFLKNWASNVYDHLSNDVTVIDREDPFNLQLAIVNDNYPLDDVLTKLNNTSFYFEFNRFYVSGILIHLS